MKFVMLTMVGLLVLAAPHALAKRQATGDIIHTVSWGYDVGEASITIAVGDTVRWVLNQQGGHNIVSGPSHGTPDGRFPSSEWMPNVNDEYSNTFAAPGVFPYYCEPHRSMLATITVLDPDSVTTSEPESSAPTGPFTVGEGEECNGSLPPQFATLCEAGLECVQPDDTAAGASGRCVAVVVEPTEPSTVCDVDGVAHGDGSTWTSTSDPCITYECAAGAVGTMAVVCNVPDCGLEEPIAQPGQCCMSCPLACEDSGVVHQTGDSWSSPQNACLINECSNGETLTVIIDCFRTPQCDPGVEAVRREGECCATCPTTPTNEATEDPEEAGCLEVTCAATCDYGQVVNEHGCLLCDCADAPVVDTTVSSASPTVVAGCTCDAVVAPVCGRAPGDMTVGSRQFDNACIADCAGATYIAGPCVWGTSRTDLTASVVATSTEEPTTPDLSDPVSSTSSDSTGANTRTMTILAVVGAIIVMAICVYSISVRRKANTPPPRGQHTNPVYELRSQSPDDAYDPRVPYRPNMYSEA